MLASLTVRNSASSLARKQAAFAISCGLLILPSGIPAIGAARPSGVSTPPRTGATLLFLLASHVGCLFVIAHSHGSLSKHWLDAIVSDLVFRILCSKTSSSLRIVNLVSFVVTVSSCSQLSRHPCSRHTKPLSVAVSAPRCCSNLLPRRPVAPSSSMGLKLWRCDTKA